MRWVPRNLFVLSVCLLISGCTSFDPTHFWKYNRGDNVMNDDEIHAATTQPTAPQTNE